MMVAFVSAAVAERVSACLPDLSVCALTPDFRLSAPVASHADMLVYANGKRAVMDRACCEADGRLQKLCSAHVQDLILTDTHRGETYPHDIALNALSVGELLFCNVRHTSPAVLALAGDVIDVRQGYAACSTLALTDRCIVTADPSIARAAEKRNIDVLPITPGHIELPGYDTGFIGGATAKVGNTVWFFGDPSAHPDFAAIENACLSCGLEMRSFFNAPLTDRGGIRLLNV
jgi:hypothetical protein